MLERTIPRGYKGQRGSWVALAGAALVVAGGLAIYRRPFETVRSALRLGLRLRGVSERTVEVDGLPVRCLEAGRDGPGRKTLVLVHGLGGSAADWSFVMPRLSRNYRVLALDLPGFGDTPAPPEGMSFSALERYLGGFLDRLGVERAALTGNSLGGAVVIRHAARNPERAERLFLLDSAGLLYDAPPELEPRNREQARELTRLVTGEPDRTPGFVLDGMVRRAADPDRRAYLRSAEPTDVKDDLPRIQSPVTIIWGERDRLIPPDHGERMHAALRDSELIMLGDVGHIPQLQAPREVVRLVNERLS
ncbi:alpha/beta fold hydrolase [Rubrobacter aplysinae]|uniref:alpha/beta fold hydrolase n=1 Tax=Rubrobacter aplysinae TaxID=909625 RepID=UPI00069DD0A9|nr:alpha/beta fold hydrolase [Rubrobacter aplysinae]